MLMLMLMLFTELIVVLGFYKDVGSHIVRDCYSMSHMCMDNKNKVHCLKNLSGFVTVLFVVMHSGP